jgi:hypothetical protein
MRQLSEVVARVRGGLVAAEMGIRTAGNVAHAVAQKLADQVHEFRGGDDEDDDDQGGHHAAR